MKGYPLGGELWTEILPTGMGVAAKVASMEREYWSNEKGRGLGVEPLRKFCEKPNPLLWL